MCQTVEHHRSTNNVAHPGSLPGVTALKNLVHTEYQPKMTKLLSSVFQNTWKFEYNSIVGKKRISLLFTSVCPSWASSLCAWETPSFLCSSSPRSSGLSNRLSSMNCFNTPSPSWILPEQPWVSHLLRIYLGMTQRGNIFFDRVQLIYFF